MADGGAFPGPEELEAAAAELESAAVLLAQSVPRFKERDDRRRARRILSTSYDLAQALRASEPGSVEARRALRAALDLCRELRKASATASGTPDPGVEGAEDLLPKRRLKLAAENLEPPRTVRIPWPIRYDLERFERLADAAWDSFTKATRRNEEAAALEARSLAAAEMTAGATEREREPVVDMGTMELARARKHKPS